MEVSGYNLSWSTFSSHLAQLSRELHTEKYFSDLTLVSDDLVQTEAHRIILSASSPLLKSLLSISPRGQTQLFLKGVKHQQLEAVLRFLYYGEVQVPSAEITEFLRAGKELEITELRMDPVFIFVTMTINIVFQNLLPLLALAFLNISICLAGKKRREFLKALKSKRVGFSL